MGPDNESSEVSSWGESQKVESVNICDFNSWDVSDGLSQVLSFISNDDEGSSSHCESSASELSFSGSQCLGSGDSQNIVIGSESLQDLDGLFGLLNLANFVGQNEGELGNVLDSVSSSHDQSWDSGGGQSGSEGVSLLFEIDLSVPSSPGFEWVSHSTFSGLVTESSLSGSVGS